MNTELINILKAYAEKNYNKGMDSFVECYDTAEWQELIDENGGSEAKCKKMMRDLASIFKEREGY